MISLDLQQIAAITSGRLQGESLTIKQAVTDTRRLIPGCLFIALKGENFDAHDFVEQAQQGGAAALLVERQLASPLPQIIVSDCRLALGQLGQWIRQHSMAKVVALTGSSGKTSVKEMTASILQQSAPTLYTAGNLNNDLGVPMTLLRLTAEHHYAVIELGANHQGEIAYTTRLTQPDAVLVNNLAAAHLQGFGSLQGVAKAKGEIFEGLTEHGIAIINHESNDWAQWQSLLSGKRVYRFAIEGRADVDYYAEDLTLDARGSKFTLITPQGAIALHIPLPGRHNVSNALAAAALAQAVGASLEQIQRGLACLKPVSGRLFPIQLAPGQLLLDDSYNANVGSMSAAAHTLSRMPGYKVMVVGDMGELGEEAEQCHRQVGQVIRHTDIDRVLSIGKYSHFISQDSGCGQHYSDKPTLVEALVKVLRAHSSLTILIKGSRSSAMEQVVEQLQEKTSC